VFETHGGGKSLVADALSNRPFNTNSINDCNTSLGKDAMNRVKDAMNCVKDAMNHVKDAMNRVSTSRPFVAFFFQIGITLN
jgi:hypothetical protein